MRMNVPIVYIITFISLFNYSESALFSWLFKGYEDAADNKISTSNSVIDSASGETINDDKDNSTALPSDTSISTEIHFELSHSDEKFLQEAHSYTSVELSELDFCHHKVILGLKRACGEMTEEELAKVSVNLFNCQSKAEGRSIFPCTEHMTIKECTTGMDTATWTAYQVVSNRARAVCYATRQQQFTAKTEMTVKKLMTTSEQQLHNMQFIQKEQEVLEEKTSKTISSLSDGHKQLKDQQKVLSSSLNNFVATNLRELNKEKNLIAKSLIGQKELVGMTQSIRSKLDYFRDELSKQESGQREVHEMILKDLSNIQESALEVWEKLDASTQRIMSTHEETLSQYSHLTKDLQKMDQTVHQVIKLIAKVEDNVLWITELLGDTDTTLQQIYTVISHGGFIFVAMISGSFLQIPTISRVLLLTMVPLNAISEMQHQFSLKLNVLAIIIIVLVFVEIIINKIRRYFSPLPDASFLLNHSCFHDLDATLDANCSKIYKQRALQMTSASNNVSKMSLSSLSFTKQATNETKSDYSSDEEQEISPNILKKNEEIEPIKPNFYLQNNSKLNNSVCDPLLNASTIANLSTSEDHKDSDISPVIEVKTPAAVKRHLFSDSNIPKSPSIVNLSLGSGRSRTPTRSPKPRNVSQSGTPKRPCAATCRNGAACKLSANNVSPFCHRHAGGSREGTPF